MSLLFIFFIVFSPILMADSLPVVKEPSGQPDECNSSVLMQSIDILDNQQFNIRTREKRLSVLLTACPRQQITQPLLQKAVGPNHLEWFLRKHIIQWIHKNNSQCNKEIVQYLWSSIQQDYEDHYVREDMIWTLSDTLQDNQSDTEIACDTQVIQWLSEFIQRDQSEFTMNLVDFRSRMILPLFLSIVRLGIRNQNELAAQELKAIALNHEVNDYFRSVAVESLQSLGVYLQSGALGLYEVVQEISMRYIGRPNLEMKDAELILDNRDRRIRQYAYDLLKELTTTSPDIFLSFVFINQEKVDAYKLYWRRALQNFAVPENNHHAIGAMEQLSKDSKVSAKYRKQAEKLLFSITMDLQGQAEKLLSSEVLNK